MKRRIRTLWGIRGPTLISVFRFSATGISGHRRFPSLCLSPPFSGFRAPVSGFSVLHSAFCTLHSTLCSPRLHDGDRKQAARFNAETAEHAEKGADWGKANGNDQGETPPLRSGVTSGDACPPPFVIRISSFIRHSVLGFRHFPQLSRLFLCQMRDSPAPPALWGWGRG